MTYTHDSDQLSDLLSRASERGANIALAQAGIIKPTITLAQVKKVHGRDIANEARMNPKIKWVPLGKGGRTSGVYCLRADFDIFLFAREFDFNKK